MKRYQKRDFPVEKARRFLEPGPIVLVSSAWKDRRAIMTMGWHIVLEFSPSLIGCYIWDRNDSHALIRRSRECVINVPEAHLAETVVDIGNTDSSELDKFAAFGLTARRGAKVSAPLIAECHTNIECRLVDTRLIRRYSLFVFQAVKIHAAVSPKYPRTIHYTGDGIFRVTERTLSLRRRFKPEML